MTDRVGKQKEKGQNMRNRFYFLCRLNLPVINSTHISKEGLLKSLQSSTIRSLVTRV
jgi:hypothetical protein